MHKAAEFLASQMQSFGIQPMDGKNYFQPFTYPANTFPGKMEVKINGVELMPGRDFIISPASHSTRGKGFLLKEDSTHYTDPTNRVSISLEKKLTWSVATTQSNDTEIDIDKNVLQEDASTLEVNIEGKLVAHFKAANVCGLVKGTLHPDSIIVFTAHYDHLGGMGDQTYFPGANDNASGISLLLGLAKYYAANPQPYTIAFICFAGEEAGLIGSKYFVDNPLIPLKNIRFLTNVDLVGTGIDGITVVNATEFPKEFKFLNEINDKEKYLAKINARGKAANSDHYWFTEKGVPAFFIYTLGGIAAYHDVFDKASTLPLNKYEDLFKLIVKFNEGLMR